MTYAKLTYHLQRELLDRLEAKALVSDIGQESNISNLHPPTHLQCQPESAKATASPFPVLTE
jgi:hypothetical protein